MLDTSKSQKYKNIVCTLDYTPINIYFLHILTQFWGIYHTEKPMFVGALSRVQIPVLIFLILYSVIRFCTKLYSWSACCQS